MTEKLRSELDVEVRYAETDQMGVVHHANYLVWFEQARTHLCARSGYPYAEIEELGYLLMVTGVEVVYRGAARYGDTVTVHSWMDWLGSRGVRFAYEVKKGIEVLVTGRTDHVWVDVKTRRNCRIPEVLQAPFLELAKQESLLRGRPRRAG